MKIWWNFLRILETVVHFKDQNRISKAMYFAGSLKPKFGFHWTTDKISYFVLRILTLTVNGATGFILSVKRC